MFKVYSTYGIWIAVILIAYFLLLKLFGFHEYPTLSAVNGLIYGVGIYMALTAYRGRKNRFKYEKAFEVGMMAGSIATIIFTVFMAVYMYQIDTEFPATIMERWNFEADLETILLLTAILIMGVVTSLVLTFSFMQLLKRSWNTKDGARNTL